MNDNYRCGDHEALIAFVYGECDESDGKAVAAHVAACTACAEELEGLRSSRTALAAWAPPETSLGFRITGTPEAAAVLRPAVWWRQPLPAWAQVAAAILIFAAGMTFGARQQPVVQSLTGSNTPAAPLAPATARVAPVPAASRTAGAAAAAPQVSRDDFVRLEQRLRAMETATTQPASMRTASAGADEPAVIQRIEAMIVASEERQRAESARLVEAVALNIARQRQYDLQQVERRIGQVYSTTDATLRQHSTAINSLAFASFPQPSGAR
jgi:hypothetical protein